MQTAKKKDAPRIARPAVRYWKGKAPKGAGEIVDSDSESDQERAGDVDDGGVQPVADVPIGVLEGGDEDDEDGRRPHHAVPQQKIPKSMSVALRDVDISKEGKVIVAGRAESGRTAIEQVPEEGGSEEEAAEAAPEEEEESSEYETDSEDDDVKPANMFRPVFVPKRARDTIAAREAESEISEDALRKRELEAEQRRKQSHDMVAESIRRELAEKDTEERIPDVDDTDGVDPTAEFEAWRLRELGRIKRETEEDIRREEERAEIERRRALPEEVRLKEDMERAQKSRDDKPKGQQKFLQKYWHKGAFHQDHDVLKRHDFTEATESTVDVTLLPKVMQVKDFGKRSRTKYTHLLDQDTTIGAGGFGSAGSTKPTTFQGCFVCGGPHLKKDCPRLLDQVGNAVSGANRTIFASTGNELADDEEQQQRQKWRKRDGDDHVSKPRGEGRAFDDNFKGGEKRDRDDQRRPRLPRRSRSRSRSRGRDYYDGRERRRVRRSRSRSVDPESRGDKRQRVS